MILIIIVMSSASKKVEADDVARDVVGCPAENTTTKNKLPANMSRKQRIKGAFLPFKSLISWCQ